MSTLKNLLKNDNDFTGKKQTIYDNKFTNEEICKVNFKPSEVFNHDILFQLYISKLNIPSYEILITSTEYLILKSDDILYILSFLNLKNYDVAKSYVDTINEIYLYNIDFISDEIIMSHWR